MKAMGEERRQGGYKSSTALACNNHQDKTKPGKAKLDDVSSRQAGSRLGWGAQAVPDSRGGDESHFYPPPTPPSPRAALNSASGNFESSLAAH